MNNYMIFGRNLKVHTIEDAHHDMFKHANREWKFVPKQLMFRNKLNAEEKTPEQRKARVDGLLQKEKERRDRFKELEIDYEFPGFKALVGEKKKSAKAAPVVEKKVEKKQEAVPVPVKVQKVKEQVKQVIEQKSSKKQEAKPSKQ